MPQPGRRLTSWKEISAYIGRDVRTVARWEKERGLPVHRVPGGRGTTVFAWSDEIDRWLVSEASASASEPADASPQAGPEQPDPRAAVQPVAPVDRRAAWHVLRIAASVALLVVVFVVLVQTNWLRGAESIATVEAQGTDFAALSASGSTIWKHRFPDRMAIGSPTDTVINDVDGDGASEAVVVASKERDSSGRQAIYCFSHDGTLRWQFEPTETVDYGSESFGPPWNSVGVFPYTVGSSHRIAWLTHHHTWWPAVVRILGPDGRELSRFVHPGWLTSLAFTSTGTVLVAGMNNLEDSDAFAVLDAASLPGSAPDASTGSVECGNCATGRPAHYFLLPRSELSRAVGLPRLSSSVFPLSNGAEVQTVQLEGDAHLGSAALIFDFGVDYTPLHARANDAYWVWHDRLYREGKIDHPSSRCPERRGFLVREWERGRGWSTTFVSAGDN